MARQEKRKKRTPLTTLVGVSIVVATFSVTLGIMVFVIGAIVIFILKAMQTEKEIKKDVYGRPIGQTQDDRYRTAAQSQRENDIAKKLMQQVLEKTGGKSNYQKEQSRRREAVNRRAVTALDEKPPLFRLRREGEEPDDPWNWK